ncbi:GNAT family N-acetyltransferase [Nocardioides zeae]|uniref:GNAT family N-acetyltransferase n=1 Tax=Nocardioides imazamoxiresistens TaxID=3231893 RepID=A0ABU3PUU8_9ACTN|nr:GNAT family N-acetyltransferase [Nocardioides zeae]MDT9593000.1 GNAT family N-acetyltransferase [Nocardioides zeae]
MSVLDHPVRAALLGAHAPLARRVGSAVAYAPEVATFCAPPDQPDADDWADLARLLSPGAFADLFSHPATPPDGWAPVFELDGLQMVGPISAPRTPRPEGHVELGAADVPDMLALAAATRPGPFWAGTVRMGRYVGVRRDGVLLAMAGERLRPPGFTEVSAVCARPEARGQGLATALVAELVRGVATRGERAFLHVAADNPALGVYERLGFTARREVRFHGWTTPA